MNRFLSIVGKFFPRAWGSSYESANYSPRRGRVPGSAPGDTKRDLSPGIRSELVRRSRYLQSMLLDDGTHRDLPASSILHIFEPESASSVRNAATIQHSINHVLDEMELLALEKHAVKDNADVARILKTARGEIAQDGDFSLGSASSGPESSDPTALQRIVGGKLVALKPDEVLCADRDAVAIQQTNQDKENPRVSEEGMFLKFVQSPNFTVIISKGFKSTFTAPSLSGRTF
ncbi:MAG: hypothetical protein IAE94_13150 [Chthoniobacterales bacterium]|nr:hypothetical protein [Chthoniobacterales bacterium]